MQHHYKALFLLSMLALLTLSPVHTTYAQQHGEWLSLFDGKTLDDWKVGNNVETFSVKDGQIVVHGETAHLFYNGPVQNHNFKDFEFKADIKTTRGSNSGVYFHTTYQPGGWPSQGYEVQVNNSHSDPIRTGSLYNVDDIRQAPAADGEWFTMYIKVKGDTVTIKVDGKTLVQYTEPDDVDRDGRVLSSGTFALQGHDPDSKVYYKNIMVRPL